MSKNERKDGFHGSTGLARRGVVGAASQKRRELNHGRTGKVDPLWGLKAGVLATVNWLMFHGSLGANHGTFKSRYFPILGHRNSVRYRTRTPALAPYDLENPKDYRLLSKI